MRDDGHRFRTPCPDLGLPMDFVRGLRPRAHTRRRRLQGALRAAYPRARRHWSQCSVPLSSDDQKRSHSVVLAGEAGDGIPVLSRYDAFDLRPCVRRSFGPESDDLRHAGHEVSPSGINFTATRTESSERTLLKKSRPQSIAVLTYPPCRMESGGRSTNTAPVGGFLLRSGYSFAIAVEHLEPDVYVRIGFAVRAGESHDGLGVPFLDRCMLPRRLRVRIGVSMRMFL